MALSEPDPELFTIATLTGHACLGKLNTPWNFRLIFYRLLLERKQMFLKESLENQTGGNLQQ
jgi:hypothetical protein